MKVRLSTAVTTNKVVRLVSRIKHRTAEAPRKGSRGSARKAAWNNWLIEENYL